MKRYLRLASLVFSSALFGFGGFLIALGIMLPLILRYSSDSTPMPQWVRMMMGILGYGLPIIFFTSNMVTHWRWADENKAPLEDPERKIRL